MTNGERLAMWAAVILAPIAFAVLAAYSYRVRGYVAFGGEWLSFLLPFFTRIAIEVRRGNE